ncbi:peptidylprolyl isomerase [Frigoriflavimonas asaccharolytica]|uniref:Periplasmic chaperone PpiD n=1 Tax=Frigoriflavimonas asaccharolytica TaxID=2735899 RepID=A0A8J8G4N8_9FLAO|nr:peptidylprolyl isomerase [Frigoriflavimonas asaccharolytica]NRS91011.1 peptidyl-prolyl cis-trans isomerase D [Frigoriflavimonas asaccharolytica]
MAILGEIRKRPILLMGIIALALLAFLVNPDTFDKLFGKNPSVMGKVNGEEISRDEYNDQLYVVQQQAQQQGQPSTGLEEQAWQILVQSKLIKQQFEKMGFTMTDDFFWSQLQFDPNFAQDQNNFDEKGNFKLQEIKGRVEALQTSGQVEAYNQWMKNRKSIEYRMMYKEVSTNINSGITVSKKEAQELMKQRDQLADIDYVQIDYNAFNKKNPTKVTTEDLTNYIKRFPIRYKTDASVNLGVVFFPAKPSAGDETIVKNDIQKLFDGTADGVENFQNTTNDSTFITLNSEVPFNSAYIGAEQLPPSIGNWVKTASVGQTFGPFKEQEVYVVSKLIGKKPSDSSRSKHILIGYAGSERSTATRTKEQAKKIADSLLSVIKATPAKFAEGLKLSDEPNAVERDGEIGWTTSDQQGFAQGYLDFLSANPSGTFGLAETQFGYHIINIEEKKSGAMTYKVANLVKSIRASQATTDEVDKKARKFIQQIDGKSFNDFVNVAKKGSLNYSNPKTVKRFQGSIDGLGTAKDGEVISWAFDKKREKGDTDLVTVDGTGDKIVVFLNGRQDKGLVNGESVRDEIEATVKNELIAKKIIEKINASKPSSLDQVAKTFASAKQSAQVNMINPQVNGMLEPKIAGAAFGIAKGKISQPIEGMTGVFMIVKKSESVNKQPGELAEFLESTKSRNAQTFNQQFLKSLQDNADIKDYRIEVWDKQAQ